MTRIEYYFIDPDTGYRESDPEMAFEVDASDARLSTQVGRHKLFSGRSPPRAGEIVAVIEMETEVRNPENGLWGYSVWVLLKEIDIYDFMKTVWKDRHHS